MMSEQRKDETHPVRKARRAVPRRTQSRMPKDSLYFEKLVPALLISFGVITIVLIIFAAGILLGLIPYA